MTQDSLCRSVERRFLRPFFRRLRGQRAPAPPTLRASLEALSEQAAAIDPRGPLLAWGRRALNLEEEAERGWFSRAWWGHSAWRLVRETLQQGRVEEVMELLVPPDTRPLDEALGRGRGAVLACAHLGPYSINRFLFSRMDRDLLLLGDQHWSCQLNIKHILVSREAERKLSMASCLLHLRNNGAVMIAADGRWGQGFRPFPFLNHSVGMSVRTAQLARIAVAPTLWLSTLWDWESKKIRMVMTDSGLDPAQASDRWEDLWMTAFLGQLAEVMVRQPENLSFVGGFWDAPREGFASMS